MRFFPRAVPLWAVIVYSVYSIGCQSSSSSHPPESEDEPEESGVVTLLLADGPAEDYDNLFVTLLEIALLPAAVSDPVSIFESSGLEIDLLELRDEDLILAVSRVPPGTYTGVRLRVADVRAVGGPCAPLTLDVPAGVIDLSLVEALEITIDGHVALRVDIDVEKSLQIADPCTFRPVVFVEVENDAPARCPRSVSGTITEVLTGDDSVFGFAVDLGVGRGEVEVGLDGGTAIFQSNASVVDAGALEVGQTVHLRGPLTADGVVDAAVVVIGEALVFDATAASAVVGGVFSVNDASLDTLLTPQDVTVLAETAILMACDEGTSSAMIAGGARVRVFGTFTGGGALVAAAILLRSGELFGDVHAIAAVDGGFDLTFRPEGGVDQVIHLPAGTDMTLPGVGAVPVDLFQELLACQTIPARILFDLDAAGVATAVHLEAEVESGLVVVVDPFFGALLVGDRFVGVFEEPTIIDLRGGTHTVVTLEDLDVTDNVHVFGFDVCTGDESDSGVGFVILITE